MLAEDAHGGDLEQVGLLRPVARVAHVDVVADLRIGERLERVLGSGAVGQGVPHVVHCPFLVVDALVAEGHGAEVAQVEVVVGDGERSSR